MDDLIIRSLQGRATPEEEERLRAWRRSDPDHEARFRALRDLWEVTAVAAPRDVRDLPDVHDLVERAEGRRGEVQADSRDVDLHPSISRSGEASSTREASSPWLRRAALGVLAAGLVAVGFGVGTIVGDDGSAPFAAREIETGAGEMTTITLADGSSVRLGPRSTLRLTEGEDRRTARLEGRAYFGVQTDSARPFVVDTEHGRTTVFGTRFEVRAEEEFRVLVVEGEVSVEAGGTEVRLSEGEMSRSARGGPPSRERVADVYTQLDWLGDALVFQGTRLDRALSEIEARYDVDIGLMDRSLAGHTVTATFTGRPIEHVVLVLCEIVNTTCAIDDDRVRIGGGSPGRPATSRAEAQ